MLGAFFAPQASTAMLPLQPNTAAAADVELRTAGDLMNICAATGNYAQGWGLDGRFTRACTRRARPRATRFFPSCRTWSQATLAGAQDHQRR